MWLPIAYPATAPPAPPIAAPAAGAPTAEPTNAPPPAPTTPPSSVPFSRVVSGSPEQPASEVTRAAANMNPPNFFLFIAFTSLSDISGCGRSMPLLWQDGEGLPSPRHLEVAHRRICESSNVSPCWSFLSFRKPSSDYSHL